MTKLLNIFSKPKQRIIKNNIRMPLIVIDYREKNSLVASELVKQGFMIEFKELNVADYIVKDVAIERKSVVSDTPVIIRDNNITKMTAIKEAYNLFKKNKKLKAMGINFSTKKIGWFNVYGATKHSSNKIYGISLSPKTSKKYENEKTYDLKITNGHNIYVFRNKKIMCIPTREVKRGDYLLIVPPRLEENKIQLHKPLNEFLEDVQSDSTKGYKISKRYLKSVPQCSILNSKV